MEIVTATWWDSWIGVVVPSYDFRIVNVKFSEGEWRRHRIEFRRVGLWSCFRTRVVILTWGQILTTTTTIIKNKRLQESQTSNRFSSKQISNKCVIIENSSPNLKKHVDSSNINNLNSGCTIGEVFLFFSHYSHIIHIKCHASLRSSHQIVTKY